jgi:putative colanic acid biosynthesis acetyltransferase WcaF
MPIEAPYLGQGCVTPFSRREVLLSWLWSFVQSTVFRWSPRPLHGFRARLLRLFGADIPHPREVVIFPTVRVLFPWNLTLQARAMLGRDVNVYNPGRVTLGRGANVSQHCHLCAGSHDFIQWSMPLVTAPIVLGDNTWLAADVFVGPGVTIGELSVVGARSVVTRDLPPHRVCVGHPCRPIRDRPPPQP